MSFKLYPAQLKVAKDIINGFLSRDFILLTGEVGVGKTYISAYIIKRYQEKHAESSILIVSPKQMVDVWNTVLTAANVNVDNITITTSLSKKLVNEMDFVVYDEVHTIKQKKSHFADYVQTNKKFLGLTGSIIDKSVNDITTICDYFSNDGAKYYRYSDMRKTYKYRDTFETKIEYVRMYIEPLLTIGISKHDIEHSSYSTDKIIINTTKENIEMSNEESAFYNFMTKRLNKLHVHGPKRLKLLNDYLDRIPNHELYVEKRFNTIEGVKKSHYFIGEILHKDEPYKLLLLNNYLKQYKNKTIIYTLNDDLAKQISNETDAEYVDSNEKNAVEEINKLLQYKSVVINILPILTGISLEADTIIWYQTPLSLSQDIQGVGRITRLNSNVSEKNVIYFYHKNTLQEELINQLTAMHNLNNELIRKKSDTNKEYQLEHIPFYESISYYNLNTLFGKDK